MQLKEFDTIMDRMTLALETAKNLGQPIEEAKILYQMNEILPENFQLLLDTVRDELEAREIITNYKSQIKSRISEYRENLMLN